MDYGRLAIARAVTDKNIGPILERGLTPEMMPTPEDRSVLSFVLDFYKKHRDVPSPQAIENQFPGYTLGYAPDPTSFYVDKILEQFVRAEVQETLLNEAKGLVGKSSPFDVLDKLRSRFGRLSGLGAVSLERDIAECAYDRLQAYEDRKNNVGLLGIPTPWPSLDDLTQGWQKEMYVGVAARPKTGKTWLLLRLAHKAWKEGYNVLFFNKEVRTDIMEQRFDALEWLLPYKRFREGMLTSAEEQRYRSGLLAMEKKPPKNYLKFIHGVNTVSHIGAKVDEYDPDIVFIDGAYLLVDELRARQEWERQKNLSRAIKALSQETTKPIIISIQLGRGGDIKQRTTRGGVLPITMADVAGSDAFAQDVDLLIGLEQTEDMRLRNELKIIPLAVREAAPEPILVGWDFDTMKSEDFGVQTTVVEADAEEEEILNFDD